MGRRLLQNLSLSFVSFLIVAVVCEVLLRFVQLICFDIPFLESGITLSTLDGQATAKLSSILDDKLGWKPKPNYLYVGHAIDANGVKKPIRVSQNGEGFRSYGNVDSGRTKILVLGDSYTQAVEVSDGKAYYDLLGVTLGAEIFAVASRGYGSYQEYLTLDRYFDRIGPDLVVWQFCYNDFMNNSHELESAWLPGRLGIERPYYEHGVAVNRIPEGYAPLLRLNSGVFRLIYLIFAKIDRLRYTYLDSDKDRLLNEILEQGVSHAKYKRAVDVTYDIFGLVRNRVGDKPVVLFEACTTAPQFHTVVAELAQRYSMHFVADLPAAIDLARAGGTDVFNIDNVHYNENGHQIVAAALERVIHSANLLEH